ncbi:MAG: YicC family protein [Rhodobacteraceae bacterium]|nr:MAG: YicC family protein [Paracoccaceae bacterium]
MTGFAACDGETDGARWRWEARSVNGRGLDLRLRLADGWEALEPEVRRRAAALGRGSVSITLKIDAAADAARPSLDRAALALAVAAAAEARAAAEAAGLPTAPIAPERLLAVRGVMETRRPDAATDAEATRAALLDGLDRLLAALTAMRRDEGARLGEALAAILDAVEAETARAEAAHAAQAAAAPARLREKVAALLGAGAEVAEDRLAQELALLAVKADVREEIDRLRVHVAAARALLAGREPAGRKLDFLTQEFNREANTLCAKAASPALTDAGLALKVLVDQMREQAANLA